MYSTCDTYQALTPDSPWYEDFSVESSNFTRLLLNSSHLKMDAPEHNIKVICPTHHLKDQLPHPPPKGSDAPPTTQRISCPTHHPKDQLPHPPPKGHLPHPPTAPNNLVAPQANASSSPNQQLYMTLEVHSNNSINRELK